jgi:hypothetical protein
MENQEVVNALAQYKSDLEGILSRFHHSRDRIDIDTKDDPIYRQKIVEVIDLLNDCLGENDYSKMISRHFNFGISNFFRTPSYKSVENIIGVLGAVITRFERDPQLVTKGKVEKSQASKKAEVAEELTKLTRAERKAEVMGAVAAVSLGLFLIGVFMAFVHFYPWNWLIEHKNSLALQIGFAVILILCLLGAFVPKWRKVCWGTGIVGIALVLLGLLGG